MHPFASQWNLDSELYPLVGDLLEGREVVLDVGCGDGTLARYLARRGHQVLGIDREPEVLPSDSEGTHFELADASNLPFGFDSFDAAVAVSSLHHNARPGLVLGEMRRVLKPGGVVVVVGQALDRTPADMARTARGVTRARWMARGKTRWDPGAPVVEPTMGWSETKALLEEYLEGVSWERVGSHRYVAVWHRA